MGIDYSNLDLARAGVWQLCAYRFKEGTDGAELQRHIRVITDYAAGVMLDSSFPGKACVDALEPLGAELEKPVTRGEIMEDPVKAAARIAAHVAPTVYTAPREKFSISDPLTVDDVCETSYSELINIDKPWLSDGAGALLSAAYRSACYLRGVGIDNDGGMTAPEIIFKADDHIKARMAEIPIEWDENGDSCVAEDRQAEYVVLDACSRELMGALTYGAGTRED